MLNKQRAVFCCWPGAGFEAAVADGLFHFAGMMIFLNFIFGGCGAVIPLKQAEAS